MHEYIGDKGDRWEFYRDNIGEWRWRRFRKSGQMVDSSTEGYASEAECLSNARINGMDSTGIRRSRSIRSRAHGVQESDTYSAFVEKDKKTFTAHSKKVKDELKNQQDELKNQQNEINKYQQEQQKIIEDLKEKIDGLLPGATSAGLATVFKNLKEKSQRGVLMYTLGFGVSLLGLFLTTRYFFLMPESTTEWFPWLQGLFAKALFFAPLLWLVIFFSKRRSEHQRLELEYTHKEAVARSFQGYKEQINELELKDEKLLEELLSTTIKAIGYNASVTLGGKHGDDPPFTEAAKLVGLVKNID